MISNSNIDYYDDLDMPPASYTDRVHHDPKTLEDYIQFIKLGSQIKENLVKQTEQETSVFLLTVLQSIINEQIQARLLDRDTGDYIYQAVRDQAIRKKMERS